MSGQECATLQIERVVLSADRRGVPIIPTEHLRVSIQRGDQTVHFDAPAEMALDFFGTVPEVLDKSLPPQSLMETI